MRPERQAWFGCACCPPNIARTISQLGAFAYGQRDDLIAIHLYLPGTAELVLDGVAVRLTVTTGLPWAGWATIRVQCERPVTGTIALRLPGWCTAPELSLNGVPLTGSLVSGTYHRLRQTWHEQEITLTLPMQAQRIFAHPAVRSAAGKVAVQRGALVYAWEEQDAGTDLDDCALPDAAELTVGDSPQLGGMVTISAPITRTAPQDWAGPLYRSVAPQRCTARITAIPYCLWANRTKGEMRVWLRRS